MNVFQKAGAFAFRIVGTFLLIYAGAGLAYAVFGAASATTGAELDRIFSERFGAAVLWIVVGTAFVALAAPLGKLIGRGLD